MKRGLIFSLLLHSLMAVLLIQEKKEDTPQEQAQQESTNPLDKVIPKTTDSEDVKPNEIEVSIIYRPATTPSETALKECDDKWYGGVGIEQDWDGVILIVFSGYPADKAGILPQDVLVNRMAGLRGEPGTTVQVYIKRGEQLLVFNLIREKICLEK